MGDLSVAKNRMKETFGPGTTKSPEDTLTDLVVTFTKATADGMASTTTADTKFFTNPFDFALKVVSGIVNPDAALVSDNANKARVSVKTDDGANSAPAVVLEWDTRADAAGTGTWAVDIAEPNVGANNSQAAARLAPGANLWFAIAKDGTGVVVPISTYAVRLQRID